MDALASVDGLEVLLVDVLGDVGLERRQHLDGSEEDVVQRVLDRVVLPGLDHLDVVVGEVVPDE